MTPEQREELKAAAQAASPGPWKGDRYDGMVKYELLDANENAVIKGDNGNSGDGGYGITNFEDEVYLKAANPAAILSMIAQVEALTVPQGWKLVPIEPTDDMATMGFAAATSSRIRAKLVYAAMLDAAPTIPTIPGTKEGA